MSFADQLAVEPLGNDRFTSKLFPRRQGNNAAIAYGGCTSAIAVHSACKTVSPKYHIYSVLGAFHGPTKIDRKLNCRVERTRDTKTFATRRVVASQTQDDGSERACIDIFVDFHVREAGMFSYSVKPFRSYGDGPLDSGHTATNLEIGEKLVREGAITQQAADKNRQMFAMYESFLEQRQCTDGVSGQNLMGLAKNVSTTQDHLRMTDRTSAEWLKVREPLGDECERVAAIAFIMDGALSFLPLNLDKKNFDDAGPCSTLDFALRIMVPDLQLHQWHMRERRTIAAAAGRAYSEGRLWAEDGTLVAVENQSCIIRPPAQARAKI